MTVVFSRRVSSSDLSVDIALSTFAASPTGEGMGQRLNNGDASECGSSIGATLWVSQ